MIFRSSSSKKNRAKGDESIPEVAPATLARMFQQEPRPQRADASRAQGGAELRVARHDGPQELHVLRGPHLFACENVCKASATFT